MRQTRPERLPQTPMTTFSKPVILCIALAACGGGGDDKSASVDLFGKKPVPPGDLAKVKAGMTQDEVKKLLPAAKKTPNHSGSPSLTIPSGYANVDYRIGFYSDKDEVADVSVHVPKDLGKQLEKAWGPPSESGPMGTRWVNEDDGYEVRANEMGRKTWVDFRPFTPLTSEFFGKEPAPLGVLSKVKLGMTYEEIAAVAPGFEKAGAPRGNGSYIAHDPGVKDVSIEIDYDQDNKAEGFVIKLPERGPDLVVKAWGARPGTTRGHGGPMHCWDMKDGNKIELTGTELRYTTPERSVCELKQ